MPSLSPTAGPIDGTETIPLNQSGSGATLTLAQLKVWAKGGGLIAGAPNPPVGMPAPSALDGTEQVRIYQGGGWRIATLVQLAAWATTGAAGAFTLATSGRGIGLPPVSALDGTEAVMILQARGWKALGLAQLQAFIVAA